MNLKRCLIEKSEECLEDVKDFLKKESGCVAVLCDTAIFLCTTIKGTSMKKIIITLTLFIFLGARASEESQGFADRAPSPGPTTPDELLEMLPGQRLLLEENSQSRSVGCAADIRSFWFEGCCQWDDSDQE